MIRPASRAGQAWDMVQPGLLRLLLKVLLSVSAVLALPLLALAVAFVVLDKPWWWWALPGAVAVSIVTVAFVVWLVVRWRLNDLRERLSQAARVESFLMGQEPKE